MKIHDESLLKEIKANAVHAVEFMLERDESVHAFDIGKNQNTGDDVLMVMQIVLRRDLPEGLVPVEHFPMIGTDDI